MAVDASFQTDNYRDKDGDRLVINGELSIEASGKITKAGVQGAAIASLTDSSGGTANDTLEAISATYVQAEVRNSFADLGAKVNAILVRLRDVGIIAP